MATYDPNVDKDKPSGLIDIVRHRWVYIGISLALLLPAIFFILQSMLTSPTHAPLRLGIDFTGGTILEYGFKKPVSTQDLPLIRDMFAELGYPGAVVQLQEQRFGEVLNAAPKTAKPAAAETPEPAGAIATAEQIASVVSIRTKELDSDDGPKITAALSARYGSLALLQKSVIGPTLASELMTNGLLALGLAYVLIVGYLTFRFQFDYAVAAILALIHDTVFLIGFFSMLGTFYGTEVDSLFITAVLTVVGFSVHDTIVVFDRLRENTRLYRSKHLPFSTIANISVNQTLARSINTSLTALLPLITLLLFGGETTHDFVLAMIVGIAAGTYSSIFVATLILTWWRERQASGRNTPARATA